MRRTLSTGLAVFVVAVASAWVDDKPAVQTEIAQLQGEWSMASGERDGQPFPEDFVKGSSRVCKGDETTVTVGGQLFMKAQFTVDPSKQPKTIDYRVTDGPNKGKTQLGLYAIDGDTVKFCFSGPEQKRPTDFTTKPGDGRTLSVWIRLKK
jgi:uncharacterized protein (TIGR03067 family)